MHVQPDFEALSGNYICREEAISMTYSECVSVASVSQHAKRIRRIIFETVTYLALSYFLHIIS